MTNKQKVWLESYLACWNGAEAARQAGYRFPRQSAYDNLTNPYIQQRIRERLAGAAMSADEVLSRLADHARGDIEDFILLDLGEGRTSWTIDLIKAKKRGKLHLVRRLRPTRYGVDIELYDAQRALELLGKGHGLFKDRQELDLLSGGKPIPIREIVVIRRDGEDEPLGTRRGPAAAEDASGPAEDLG